MRQLIIIFITLCSSIMLCAQQNKTDALEAKINAAIEQKDYRTIARLCETLLASKPKNTYWLTIAGNAYFNTHNYHKAKEKYSLAVLYAEKKDEVLYANLGAAYQNLNEDEKAYENFRKAIAIKQTPQTVFNAASSANNLNRSEESIQLMDKAIIPLEPAFQSLYGRGYLKLHQPQQAVDHFEQFLKGYDPAHADIDMLDTTTEKRFLLQAYAKLLIVQAKEEISTPPDWQRITYLYTSLLETEGEYDARSNLAQACLACITRKPQWKPQFEHLMLETGELTPNQRVLALYALNDYDRVEETANAWLHNHSYTATEKDTLFMKFALFARPLNRYLHQLKASEKYGSPLLYKLDTKYNVLLPEAADIHIADATLDNKMSELAELTKNYISYINKSEELQITEDEEWQIVKTLVLTLPDGTVRNDLLDRLK